MPAPEQLRDRSAHRVADRDDRTGVELDERRRAVVGAVGEPEDAARAQAARVAAQVGRDDPEVLARAVRTPGTSSARRSRPSRAAAAASARRAAGQLAHERRAAAGELDAAAAPGAVGFRSRAVRYAMQSTAVGELDRGRGPRVASSVRRARARTSSSTAARSRRRQHRDVAHRRDALLDLCGRERLRVPELGGAHRPEPGQHRGRLPPVLVVAPRRALLHAVHDRPDRVDPRRHCGRARSRSGRRRRPAARPRASRRRRGRGRTSATPARRSRVERRVAERHRLGGRREQRHVGEQRCGTVARIPATGSTATRSGATVASSRVNFPVPAASSHTRRPGPRSSSVDEPVDRVAADTPGRAAS